MGNENSNRLTLTIALTVFMSLFAGANILFATWSNPDAAPPADNVPAPINTSSSIQEKEPGGQIGADIFTARTQIQSDQYCNQDGSVCYTLDELSQGGGGGGGESALCADDDLLVNGDHTCGECRELGGVVESDRSGNIMCRFYTDDSAWCDGNQTFWGCSGNFFLCPEGWSRYEQWSTTVSRTCNQGDYCGPCTTGSHPWSNRQPETCQFFRSSGDDNCFNRGTCVANTYEVGCY